MKQKDFTLQLKITSLSAILSNVLDIPGVSKFGEHGYDNTDPLMQAVFIANGPRFRKGVQIPFIQNIDLFHLFARLLNIESLTQNIDLDGVDRLEIWQQMLTKTAIEPNVNYEK